MNIIMLIANKNEKRWKSNAQTPRSWSKRTCNHEISRKATYHVGHRDRTSSRYDKRYSPRMV